MDSDWDGFEQGLREGDPEVLERFCDRYQEALRRLADRRLAPGLKARVAPEEVVQSAFRTFLRRAGGGQFTLPDSDRLWRLMCAITLNKVRQHARFHLRQKRSVEREVELDREGGAPLQLTDDRPGPEAQAAFAEWFERLLASFGEEGRRIAELKLQHYTNAEVADVLGCSERTVRRLLQRLHLRLERTDG